MRKKAECAKLYWLGHPRIERDGRAVGLDTRKTTALLAFLTLSYLPASRERLAALFWPEFDDWQITERERIRSELGWTLERLGRAQAAARQWEQALARPPLGVAGQAARTLQALLIRHLAQSGQLSAALRQYEEFANLLKNELGVQPDPRTREPCDLSAPAAPHGLKGSGPFELLLRTKLDIPRVRPARVERGRSNRSHGSSHRSRGCRRLRACRFRQVDAPLRVGLPGGNAGRLALSGRQRQRHASIPPLLRWGPRCREARPGYGGGGPDGRNASRPGTGRHDEPDQCHRLGGTGIVLVLDDYQFIQSVEIHEAVRFLVDRKPPLLRLVIATLEDPPLPLARLRSHGSLTEIRADDLRFTTPEPAFSSTHPCP